MAVKKCTKCGVAKKLSGFSKRKISKDGLNTWCKVCRRMEASKYRDKNRKKINEQYRKYYQNNKEKLLACKKKYYEENKEKWLANKKKYNKKWYEDSPEYYKKWRLANPEKCKEHSKKWKKANPEKCKEHLRKYRAQRVAVAENYTKADESYTRQIFQNRCYNCGSTKKICVDHNNPLSKGFPLTKKNAVLLCSGCNSRKHDKMPAEFYSKTKLKKLEKILGISNKE